MSVQDILDASDNTFFDGLIGNLDPSVGGGEVFRPVRDGTFLTSPLDSTAAFPKQSRPILLTTVTNEATPTIYGSVDLDPVPPADFESKVGAAYTENSTQTLINSAFYKIPPSTAQDADIRPTLQVMVCGITSQIAVQVLTWPLFIGYGWYLALPYLVICPNVFERRRESVRRRNRRWRDLSDKR